MLNKNSISVLCIFFLTGCLCNNHFLNISIDRDYDYQITCKEIEYEIGVAKIELTSIEKKHQYWLSQGPSCIMHYTNQLNHATNTIQLRLDKLRLLSNTRNCNTMHNNKRNHLSPAKL